MKMFTNILKYIFVICLTFSSMVQMSVLPQVTIVDEMREELGNCSFAAEILKQSGQGDLFSSCVIPRPSLIGKTPSTDDLNFFFFKFLCMELFDLTLQICGKNVTAVKFPTLEDIHGQNLTTFCEKLEFSASRARNTSLWADIAVNSLKDRTFCESQCIKPNYLNPLCGAVSLANKLLIAQSQQQQTVVKSDSQAVVHPKQEHEASESKAEAGSPAITKNETIPKTDSSPIETKVTSLKVNESGRNPSTEEGSRTVVITAGGQAVEKHTSVVSSIQYATPTSTVASVTAGLMNGDMIKDDNREEDPSPLLGGETGDNEEKYPPGDEAGNVGPKEIGPRIPSQEGSVNEDAQSRGSGANGLPLDSKVYHDTFVDAQDSHFFAYFLTMVVICIVGYLVFHNKQKIIALALEGRRMQGSRRRPNTSSYKKLDSTVEEAVTSTCSSSSVTHVIF